MDKIKRTIFMQLPVTTCNLRCNYCYITHQRLFSGPLPKFQYSAQHVRKALSKERMGGTCLINICGDGETLLSPELIEYIRELLAEGHYIMVVTNALLSNRIDEMAVFPPELLKRLFFKFSYHYLELKKKNLLDKFFANVNKVHKAGASFTLEAIPSDELIPYIVDVKEQAIKNVGAIPHITVARDERYHGELPILTNMNLDDYQKTWGVFNSELFNYKLKIFGEKRKEFCYAGDWTFLLDPCTGKMNQCYGTFYSQNIFEDIRKPIKFLPVGNNCPKSHCYNGHAFISLGNIPELSAPTFAEMRDRKCKDGSNWLYPEMRALMESKMYESNEEYNALQKFAINTEIRLRMILNLNRIIGAIKRRGKSRKNG